VKAPVPANPTRIAVVNRLNLINVGSVSFAFSTPPVARCQVTLERWLPSIRTDIRAGAVRVPARFRRADLGCPRIAYQIALAFDVLINKDVARRILVARYKPDPDSAGPSWLTVLGNAKESLWSHVGGWRQPRTRLSART
jgi:hypothetical protein